MLAAGPEVTFFELSRKFLRVHGKCGPAADLGIWSAPRVDTALRGLPECRSHEKLRVVQVAQVDQPRRSDQGGIEVSRLRASPGAAS